MPLSWDESYLGGLRALAGDDRPLLAVGAGCVVEDPHGCVLLIRRSDNGLWALPAGTMELGESIAECAIREVFEETGLTATALTPYAMLTGADRTRTNMYGHTYQQFTVLFRIDAYEGELVQVTDETTAAGFFGTDDFPDPLGQSVRRALEHLRDFERTGSLVMR